MLIFINVVIISICLIVLFYVLLSHQQTQEALIWWNTRQYMRMYQEAEAIQNGLLQESFVIRRNLELSLVNPGLYQHQQEQYYLTIIEKFHHSLKRLNGYLSPAYIDDSLPLAIQYILLEWELRIPGLKLQTELPTDWRNESLSTSRVILMALEELLQIILENVTNQLSILVSLKSRGNFSELTIQVNCLTIPKRTYISNRADLKYLRQAFNILTHGKCFFHKKENTETWYFLW